MREHTNACHFHNTEPFRMNRIPNYFDFSQVYLGIKNVYLPHLKNNKLTNALYKNKRDKNTINYDSS